MGSHAFAAPGWTALALLALAAMAAVVPLRVPLGNRHSDNPRIWRALTIPGVLATIWLLAATALPASTSIGLHVSSRSGVLVGLGFGLVVAGGFIYEAKRDVRLTLQLTLATIAAGVLIGVLILALIQAGTPQPA